MSASVQWIGDRDTETTGWDPYEVWRTRVLQPRLDAALRTGSVAPQANAALVDAEDRSASWPNLKNQG